MVEASSIQMVINNNSDINHHRFMLPLLNIWIASLMKWIYYLHSNPTVSRIVFSLAYIHLCYFHPSVGLTQTFNSSQHSPTSPGSDHPTPARPLMSMGKSLYFTFFKGKLPNPNLLNSNKGRSSVILPSQTNNPNVNGNSSQQSLAALQQEIKSSHYHWFCVDDELVYMSFFDDWGPLNCAMFYRFCIYIHQVLTVSV